MNVRTPLRAWTLVVLSGLSIGLTACGGDGGDDGPPITVQPVDTTVQEGEDAVLAVEVDGEATLQWQASGGGDMPWADLEGETGGTLTVDAARVVDDGRRFRVRVSGVDSDLSATSDEAMLTVTPKAAKPTVMAQPVDVTQGAGAAARFAVIASGAPLPSYQWQESRDSGASFTDIDGATQDEYALTALQPAQDQRRYRVVLTSPSGKVNSRAAVLRVTAQPVILASPMNTQWTPSKMDAAFSVEAVGPDLRYQWQASTDGGTSFANIPGATKARQVHAASGATDVDAVRVVVRNDHGSATSDAALPEAKWWIASNRKNTPSRAYDNIAAAAWVDDETVVATSSHGSVLRSTDGGRQWTEVSLDLPGGALLFRGQNGVFLGEHGQAARSDDGGRHWYKFAFPAGVSMWGMATTGDNIVAVGGPLSGEGFVAISRDGGATWTHWRQAESTLYGVAFNSAGVGVAVGEHGRILRSSDGGLHWHQVQQKGWRLLAVAFADDSTVVAVGQKEAWRSVDGGRTWKLLRLFSESGVGAIAFTSATEGVAISALNQPVRTTDGGATWQTARAGDQRNITPFGLAVGGADRRLLVSGGWDGELSRSADAGAHWETVSEAPYHGWWRDADYASDGVAVVVGRRGAMSRTTDDGESWQAIDSGTKDYLRSVAFADASIGVAVGDATVLRTVDGGLHWEAMGGGAGKPTGAELVHFSTPTRGLMTGVSGLWLTDNAGASWRRAAKDVFFRTVAFTDANTGVAIFGQRDKLHKLLRTTDGGATWTDVTPDLIIEDPEINESDSSPPPPGFLYRVDNLAFPSPGVVLAVSGSGLLRSTDGGATWSYVPVPNRSDSGWATVWFTSATEGIVATSDGYPERQIRLRTTDGGLTWTQEAADGFVNKVVLMPSGRKIAAGGYSIQYSDRP